MVTKINYSFLKGTSRGTDSISGVIAANCTLKLFINPEYGKLY